MHISVPGVSLDLRIDHNNVDTAGPGSLNIAAGTSQRFRCEMVQEQMNYTFNRRQGLKHSVATYTQAQRVPHRAMKGRCAPAGMVESCALTPSREEFDHLVGASARAQCQASVRSASPHRRGPMLGMMSS